MNAHEQLLMLKLKPEIYKRSRRYYEDQKSPTYRQVAQSMDRATREVLAEHANRTV